MKIFANLKICADLLTYKFATFKKVAEIPQIADFSTLTKATLLFYVEHPTEHLFTTKKISHLCRKEIA